MPKAVVDPEELLRFVAGLRRFNSSAKDELAVIHRQFRRLSETWADEEHAKFAESFEAMVRVFARFLDESETAVPVLTRKAEAIRAYLGT